MLTLTANENLSSLLGKAEGLTQIRDTQGKILGFYAPASLDQAALTADNAGYPESIRIQPTPEHILNQIDPEEIKRRRLLGDRGDTWPTIRGRLNMLQAEMDRRAAAGELPFTEEQAMAFYHSLQGSNGKMPAQVES